MQARGIVQWHIVWLYAEAHSVALYTGDGDCSLASLVHLLMQESELRNLSVVDYKILGKLQLLDSSTLFLSLNEVPVVIYALERFSLLNIINY